MTSHKLFLLTLITINLLMWPVLVLATNHCPSLELSAEEVHTIVAKEREEKNDDFPSAYLNPEYEMRKNGCYYVYQEYELPRVPHGDQTFRLNRFGVIVDISIGGRQWEKMKCPEKVFSEKDLTKIIKNARKAWNGLPPPYLNYEIRSIKSHCEYFYREKDLSEEQDSSVMFMIDAYGELMSFTQSKSN